MHSCIRVADMKNRDNDVDEASILTIFRMVRQDIGGIKGAI